MSWLAEDPDLLRAALDIIETWDDGNSVDGISVASPSTDGTESTNDELDENYGGLDVEDWLNPMAAATLFPGNTKPPPAPVARAPKAAPVARASKVPASRRVQDGSRELKPSTVASTRHRRREEIMYLRDKVTELESQLTSIQQVKKEEESSSEMVAANGVDHALAVMWHDISSRQQRLRQKAELEHAKLKGLLETQVKVAQGLIKLMQKARRIEDDVDFPSSKRKKLGVDVSMGLPENNQLARVEQLYKNMDMAFTFPKFHDGTVKFIDVNVADGEDQVLVEFREAWAVPFDLPEVLEAMWKYTIKQGEDKTCSADHAGEVTVDGDLFLARFVASANFGSWKGSFDGKIVAKRFTGVTNPGQHPAIVRNMCTSPHNVPPDGSGMMDGIQMHEDGWVRLVRVTQPQPSYKEELVDKPSTPTLTLVQTSQRFRLTFDADMSPANRRHAGTITDFLLDKLHQDIELKHDMVETLLLQSRTTQSQK